MKNASYYTNILYILWAEFHIKYYYAVNGVPS